MLKRFDYPRRSKYKCGVLLEYLRRTSGYSRPQVTRLVARWVANRFAVTPLGKRYKAPAAPFARKYTPAGLERIIEMECAYEDTCGPAIIHPSSLSDYQLI